MNKLTYILIFCMCALGCTQDVVYSEQTGSISLNVGEITRSASVKSSWEVGDKVAVFTKKVSSNDYDTYIYYITNTQGNLETINEDNIIMRDSYESIEIFYPYNASYTSYDDYSTRVDNYDYSNEDDYMYARIENLTFDNAHITFSFAHQLACLTFTFKAGVGEDINDLETSAGLILSDGSAVKLTLKVDGNQATDTIFVVPTSSLNGSEMFCYNYQGQSYGCALKTEKFTWWRAGFNYLYNIYEGTVYTDLEDLATTELTVWNIENETITLENCAALRSALINAAPNSIEVNLVNAREIDEHFFSGYSALKTLRAPKAMTFNPNIITGCSNLTTLELSGVAFHETRSFASSFGTYSKNCKLILNINKYTNTIASQKLWLGASWLSVKYYDHQGNEFNTSNIMEITDIGADFTVEDNSTIVIKTTLAASSGSADCLNGSGNAYTTEFGYLKTALSTTSGCNLVLLDCLGVYGSFLTTSSTLESLSMPNCTTARSTKTMQNAYYLKSMYWPVLTFTSTNSFANCTSLTEVALNSFTVAMGTYNFSGCTSLEYVYTPVMVSYSSNAFTNCTSLKKIIATDESFAPPTSECFSGVTTENIDLVINAANTTIQYEGNTATNGTLSWTFKSITKVTVD
ncbi:MAG: fimbrillin family protein [Rikenellaceae bacterium]